MKDWAIDYVRHVLNVTGWNVSTLASKAGVSHSTINRPLTVKDWKMALSRQTIEKIAAASGVSPAGFSPDAQPGAAPFAGMAEPPNNRLLRAVEMIDGPQGPPSAPEPDVKIGVHGRFAQIIATVDKPGLAKLRARLDAIEALMDD